MEYARRVLADRGRLLLSRLSFGDGRFGGYGRPPLRYRVRASIAYRMASARTWSIPRYRFGMIAAGFSQRVGERSWLVRAACAAGAIVLLVAVFAMSGSPKPTVNRIAFGAQRSSAGSSDTASVPRTTTATHTSQASAAKPRSHSSTPATRSTAKAAAPAHPSK